MQLHAFETLLEAFGIPHESAAVHDPAFTEADEVFIRNLGYTVPVTAEEASKDLVCEEPTLVFSPFAPYPVLELLLKRNWRPEYLQNVILLSPKLTGWLNDQ